MTGQERLLLLYGVGAAASAARNGWLFLRSDFSLFAESYDRRHDMPAGTMRIMLAIMLPALALGLGLLWPIEVPFELALRAHRNRNEPPDGGAI